MDPAIGDEMMARLGAEPVTRWHRRLVLLLGVGGVFNFAEVALGSLLIPLIGEHWDLSTMAKATLLAAPFVGEAVGSLTLAPLADRFGRRRMFQVNLAAYAILSALAAFSPTVAVLIIMRVLLGIGLGAELTLVDSYLAETMPNARRGRLIAASYTIALTAVPVIGVLTFALPHEIAGVASWRILMVCTGAGAIVVWLMRRSLPESPRWLISQGRYDEAEKILRDIARSAPIGHRPTVTAAPVTAAPVTAAPSAVAHTPGELRRRTILIWVVNLLNPIGFYGFASLAPLALVAKGYDVADSLLMVALTAIGYPLGSICSVFLVERIQRRTLLIASSIAVAVCGTIFGVGIDAVVIVAAGFLTGLASVVQSNVSHIYLAELFPTHMRAGAIGRPYALSRVVSAVLPLVAVPVLDAAGAGTVYVACAALVLIMAAAVQILGPKTNNRTV
ncbi:MFS transporter [Gordonia sp. DT30]|uniref:MFS transporter n=1 Tax=unclassified Gordonia (in: high G+C Gram-positive bacteria) TaxID=2657482 RepID=UPI003CECD77B